MTNIDPQVFLRASLITGIIGITLLIATAALFFVKLFATTKDPVEQGIENIQESIRGLQSELHPQNKKMLNIGLGIGIVAGIIAGLLLGTKNSKKKS